MSEYFDAQIVSRVNLTSDIALFTLAPVGGQTLPAWEPGAHIDLVAEGSPVRQYSLCGEPGAQWQIAILRESAGRGGSQFFHDHLQIGSTVKVSEPRNNFELVISPRYLFIAGGIGITPILPMIHAAERTGSEWKLVYGGRTRATMAFADNLVEYGDRVTLLPQDERGLLDLPRILHSVSDDTAIYCCGPEPLLEAASECFQQRGAGTLHVERFKPQELPVTGLQSFEVELAYSNVNFVVGPEDTILEMCQERGVPVVSSCAEGICGTCETRIVSGEPAHNDSVLTPEEQESNEVMMICVSRSKSAKLILDL